MTQESEITLHNGRLEFRIFVYRATGEHRDQDPVGTIEGVVSEADSRLIELAYTDAISAVTTKLPLEVPR